MFLVGDRATHALLLFAVTNRPPQLASLGVRLQPLRTDTTAGRHDLSGREVRPFVKRPLSAAGHGGTGSYS